MPRDAKCGIGVATILYYRFAREQPKVLLGYRVGSHAPGLWACPGGWLDAGEQGWEAAAREIHEEAGIRVRVDSNDLLTSHSDETADAWVTTLYYARETPQLAPLEREPDKIIDWRYFDLERVPLNLFGTTERALWDLVARLRVRWPQTERTPAHVIRAPKVEATPEELALARAMMSAALEVDAAAAGAAGAAEVLADGGGRP